MAGIKTIVIEAGGIEQHLSLADARALYRALHELFGSKDVVHEKYPLPNIPSWDEWRKLQPTWKWEQPKITGTVKMDFLEQLAGNKVGEF